MTKEIWKTIPDTNGYYEASNMGRIRRVEPYTYCGSNAVKEPYGVLKECNKDNGYKIVVLSIKGKAKSCYVHRLVALTFLPNPEHKKTVNHKDGNKGNNKLENLEWMTYRENNIDAIERAKIVKGTEHPRRNNVSSKPVLQLDLDGNIVNEYPSYREAARKTGIACIDKVCEHKRYRKTAGGYKWMYKEEYLQMCRD